MDAWLEKFVKRDFKREIGDLLGGVENEPRLYHCFYGFFGCFTVHKKADIDWIEFLKGI